MSSSIENVGSLINFNAYLSSEVADIAQKIDNGYTSSWNYLWLIPINLTVAVIGLAMIPIAFLVDLMGAAIFKFLSFCSDHEGAEKFNYYAKLSLTWAMMQISDIPLLLVARIFVPTLDIRPVGSCMGKCLFP